MCKYIICTNQNYKHGNAKGEIFIVFSFYLRTSKKYAPVYRNRVQDWSCDSDTCKKRQQADALYRKTDHKLRN